MKRIILLMIIATLLSGCSTIFSHTSDKIVSPGAYQGVRTDIKSLKDPDMPTKLMPLYFGAMIVLDLPFSFVADTLLLPIDTVEGVRFRKDKEQTKLLREELSVLNMEEPESDVERDSMLGTMGFMEICAPQCYYPGTEEFDRDLIAKVGGQRIAKNASLLSDTDQNDWLIRSAIHYAEQYNKKLLQVLSEKQINQK